MHGILLRPLFFGHLPENAACGRVVERQWDAQTGPLL